MKPKKPPHITTAIVSDEQALIEAMEAGLIEHRDIVRHRRRIIRRQQELRRVAGDEAWKAYLRVEEAANGRYDLALRVVAAWGFDEGQKCGR